MFHNEHINLLDHHQQDKKFSLAHNIEEERRRDEAFVWCNKNGSTDAETFIDVWYDGKSYFQL